MKKLKCYYAHTMLSYDSSIEVKDLLLLEDLGFEIINPNQQKHQTGCKEYALKHGSENIMDYFGNIVKECDVVAFRSLPDGKLLSGVAFEVEVAKKNNIPIIELPCNLVNRMMDYSETKSYLSEIGFYKNKNK